MALGLSIRPIPALEMSLFELFVALERDGWEWSVASSRHDKRMAVTELYNHGDGKRKVWWVVHGVTADTLCRPYLVLLLTAAHHQHAVPHLAKHSIYKVLLDPTWVPKPRKPRAAMWFSIGDEDPEVGMEPKPKRARRGVAQQARKAAVPLAWEGSDASANSAGKLSSSSSSRSRSNSSSSNSSSDGNGSDVDETHGNGARGGRAAPGEASSSSGPPAPLVPMAVRPGRRSGDH